MTIFQIPPGTDVLPNPLARINALIAAAHAAIAVAEAEEAYANAALETVEPHWHAHGHAAGGDCRYAGFEPHHLLPLAGLLARPWQATLATIEASETHYGLDYLLKAFPPVLDGDAEALAEEGVAALQERDDPITGRIDHKPVLALGMVWHLFGFHHHDREAWVGAFAYRGSLSKLVGTTPQVSDNMCLGEALTAMVQARADMLKVFGQIDLHDRAERRDAERQASWAAVPQDYREHGSWRGWVSTKRQRHLMRRIETARGLAMTAIIHRGEASDWIRAAGGNPRFNHMGGE